MIYYDLIFHLNYKINFMVCYLIKISGFIIYLYSKLILKPTIDIIFAKIFYNFQKIWHKLQYSQLLLQ